MRCTPALVPRVSEDDGGSSVDRSTRRAFFQALGDVPQDVGDGVDAWHPGARKLVDAGRRFGTDHANAQGVEFARVLERAEGVRVGDVVAEVDHAAQTML